MPEDGSDQDGGRRTAASRRCAGRRPAGGWRARAWPCRCDYSRLPAVAVRARSGGAGYWSRSRGRAPLARLRLLLRGRLGRRRCRRALRGRGARGRPRAAVVVGSAARRAPLRARLAPARLCASGWRAAFAARSAAVLGRPLVRSRAAQRAEDLAQDVAVARGTAVLGRADATPRVSRARLLRRLPVWLSPAGCCWRGAMAERHRRGAVVRGLRVRPFLGLALAARDRPPDGGLAVRREARPPCCRSPAAPARCGAPRGPAGWRPSTTPQVAGQPGRGARDGAQQSGAHLGRVHAAARQVALAHVGAANVGPRRASRLSARTPPRRTA